MVSEEEEQNMTELYHGVETTRDTFVISHKRTSDDKWQIHYAVKKKKNSLISNLIRQFHLNSDVKPGRWCVIIFIFLTRPLMYLKRKKVRVICYLVLGVI